MLLVSNGSKQKDGGVEVVVAVKALDIIIIDNIDHTTTFLHFGMWKTLSIAFACTGGRKKVLLIYLLSSNNIQLAIEYSPCNNIKAQYDNTISSSSK